MCVWYKYSKIRDVRPEIAIFAEKSVHMKKAVYIVILLWFARKVLGKVCSPGVRGTFRVCPRRRPGEPGYDPARDTPGEYYVVLYSGRWGRTLPGSRRTDMTYRQMCGILDEARTRFYRHIEEQHGEDCGLVLASGDSPANEYGAVPLWYFDVADEIVGFIQGVRS